MIIFGNTGFDGLSKSYIAIQEWEAGLSVQELDSEDLEVSEEDKKYFKDALKKLDIEDEPRWFLGVQIW